MNIKSSFTTGNLLSSVTARDVLKQLPVDLPAWVEASRDIGKSGADCHQGADAGALSPLASGGSVSAPQRRSLRARPRAVIA
ncbi:MAG: hypothetical protein HYX46_10650 [Betaproteobacteria bacterium]|nr:hypothetical protein [Betaproteobacteria bacterium]